MAKKRKSEQPFYYVFSILRLYCLSLVIRDRSKITSSRRKGGGGQPKDYIGLCGGRGGVKQKMMDDGDVKGGGRQDNCSQFFGQTSPGHESFVGKIYFFKTPPQKYLL